jgi:hypothetical protein
MIDVMVDIETTGTDPAHAAIIQLAAVRFDVETKEIDTAHMFDRCQWMAPGRFWDEDTRTWWNKQKPGILDGIYDRMEDPAVVMQDFFNWVNSITTIVPLRLWAKPTSFEFPFISSYMRQFNLHMPFHFRYAVDLNSYLLGKGHQIGGYWKDIEFQGDEHNALHDVLYQIKGAMLADVVQDPRGSSHGEDVPQQCPASPAGGTGTNAVGETPPGVTT